MKKIFFILLITNIANAAIVKGPYIQVVTQTSAIIKWECSYPTMSTIYYDTLQNTFANAVNDFVYSYSHEFLITNLKPNTKYYYSIIDSNQVIQSSSQNYFKTAPLPNVGKKNRFWVTGDCGSNTPNQINVLNAYNHYAKDEYTDGWLLLGDNAYQSGSDQEYNTNFFPQYQSSIMTHTPLWPAPGNHDYASDPIKQKDWNVPYYSIFSMPTLGEAGGVASGTERYYSYDYDNIHFLSLDSYGQDSSIYRMYDTLGAQVQWIKKDLDSSKKMWKVAYWHHPPFTMGSHNSDNEVELILIRQNFIQILERYGVDFILCGHSHSYERSKLMHGHYGYESQLDTNTHLVSKSSATYDGTYNSCPYVKDTIKNKGTVYIVAGSAGQFTGSQPSYPHDIMQYSNVTIGGSLILEIEKNRADVIWLAADSTIKDRFTVFKNINKKSSYSVDSGQSIILNTSWKGHYKWSDGSKDSKLVYKPSKSTLLFARDSFSCISDTFFISYTDTIIDTIRVPIDTFKPIDTTKNSIHIKDHLDIQWESDADLITLKSENIEIENIEIISIENRSVYRFENKNKSRRASISFPKRQIDSGIYILLIKTNIGYKSKKIYLQKSE